jgi:hypothetical protein
MERVHLNRRALLGGLGAVAGLMPLRAGAATLLLNFAIREQKENPMNQITFTKTTPPAWLLAFWKEIDDKTFGEGFNCFKEDAQAQLGVAVWKGREEIRESLRRFIDTGFTAHHDVVEYWDGGSLKVFRGIVTMTPDDKSKPVVKPVMTHFFYMDRQDPTKVIQWCGSVGPTQF